MPLLHSLRVASLALAAGGALVATAGLTTGLTAAPPSAARVADCTADPLQAGELAFSARVLEVSEGAGEQGVVVFRRGGSLGELNATITTTDGIATAGDDYGPVVPTVHFDDGDATVEVIRVPIVHDTIDEPPETLRLALSDVDCGSLGAITTVEITIADDDLPVTFTLGGTVSGLAGSGLVLRNLVDEVTPAADGTFTFPRALQVGDGYSVEVVAQPASPVQECAVSDAFGVMGQADITDVRVDCSTPPAIPFLDPTFGERGATLTPDVRGAVAVAVAPDGAIVTAGDDSLVRYLPDGALDPGFGAGGIVATGLDSGFAGTAIDVAVQPDGKIVVVGIIDNRLTTKEEFAIRRYDTDGLPDDTFGVAGLMTTDFTGGTDRAYAVVALPVGDILVAGHTSESTGGDSDIALVRYTSAGFPDQTFGTQGRVVTDIAGGHDFGFALAVQPDGKPVVAGQSTSADGRDELAAVIRYTQDGRPDDTFDEDGIAVTEFDATATGVALDAEGRIVLAGYANGGFSGTRSDFALIRFQPSGEIDASFGGDGLVTTDFRVEGATTSTDEFAHDLVIQPDGALVTVGNAQLDSGGDLGMTRHLSDGSPDPSFGAEGRLTVDFRGGFDSGLGVAVQPTTGRLIAVGSALNVFAVENAVIRLEQGTV